MRALIVLQVATLVACGSSKTDDPMMPNTPEAPMMMTPMDAAAKEAAIAELEAGLVAITAGSYTMGRDRGVPGFVGTEFPPHDVTITRDYWIASTEVTQAQFQAIMGFDRSSWIDCGTDCPADNVSWYDSVEVVNALSRYRGLQECYTGSDSTWTFVGLDCKGYRLPTEAEWEYAARAGTDGSFHSGDITITDPMVECDSIDPLLDRVGWYCANSEMRAHPVKKKEPNAWGLYDVHGNLWEWVHDRWEVYTTDASTDPLGGETGEIYMRRGGAYRVPPNKSQATHRVRDGGPGSRHVCVGVRVARTKS